MHDLMFAHTPYFKTRIIHKNNFHISVLKNNGIESFLQICPFILVCSVPTRFHEIPCSGLSGVALTVPYYIQ